MWHWTPSGSKAIDATPKSGGKAVFSRRDPKPVREGAATGGPFVSFQSSRTPS
jgi:hypothetical protein